jgi:ribosomal protein L27
MSRISAPTRRAIRQRGDVRWIGYAVPLGDSLYVFASIDRPIRWPKHGRALQLRNLGGIGNAKPLGCGPYVFATADHALVFATADRVLRRAIRQRGDVRWIGYAVPLGDSLYVFASIDRPIRWPKHGRALPFSKTRRPITRGLHQFI